MTSTTAHLDSVRTVRLATHLDARGALTAIESGRDVPFPIRRIFYLHGIQQPFERGGHAHPDTDQLLICMAGHLNVDLSDANTIRTFDLTDPAVGLYVPAMIWARLYDFAAGTVCLGVADTHYDNSKVIRDWADYVRRLSEGKLARGR